MSVRSPALVVAMTAMIASAHAQQPADDHLGTVDFPISCSAVQGKFDRAVALLHNFFYPETVKAFQAIIKEDPSCAIAYWGLAMSELPNPLVPPFPPANLKVGWEAIQQGKTGYGPRTPTWTGTRMGWCAQHGTASAATASRDKP